ncbi:MAG: AbrB/MazE/SpoVT family DNA-binding domain-containing protein [Pseudomonas sp.]
MDDQRRWTSFCRDAEDGSGDLVIDLPADMLAELGWKVGDRLSISVEDGLVILRRASIPTETS